MPNISWLRDLGLPAELLAGVVVLGFVIFGGPAWLQVILNHRREKMRIEADIRRKARELNADLSSKRAKLAKRPGSAVQQVSRRKTEGT